MIQVTEMNKLNAIKKICENFDYEIFQDEVLMENAKVGAKHYKIDISQCTPTFLLKVDQVFLFVIIQGSRKLDFKKLKKYLGTHKIRMATSEEILDVLDTPVGSVSMINFGFRSLIDENVANLSYCYGGCGVQKFTLKISSKDLIRVTNAEIGDFSVERNQK